MLTFEKVNFYRDPLFESLTSVLILLACDLLIMAQENNDSNLLRILLIAFIVLVVIVAIVLVIIKLANSYVIGPDGIHPRLLEMIRITSILK